MKKRMTVCFWITMFGLGRKDSSTKHTSEAHFYSCNIVFFITHDQRENNVTCLGGVDEN